ncbi:MAG TPA: putative O-glycosylation ligase, exosortase A system-associated [Gammaproteobacteria bacterium]|nr:putative O-glycosylation ligase, exosortase A system-associated [Gammaproteobacteria bacterium]
MGLRDLAVLLFTLFVIALAMRKAWYGVLALAVFSYLNPHAYAWGFVRTLPLFEILFLVVAFMTLFTRDRQPLPKDWRIPAFFFLWVYFIFTTTQAYYPELAWEKLLFVSKIFLPFIFTLILINTRKKLYYLIITIAASISIVAVKGGIFAVLSGFSYRVYGPPATQFYENNAFAIAVLIAIPLLVLWYRETTNKIIKTGIMVAIPLSYASALSSWSRGALLTMGVVTILLLWHSKRKYLVLPVILIGGFLAIQNLPEDWFGRMGSIETYQEDTSAMGRIETWKDGWYHTLKHPFTGAGFEGWRWVSNRDWHNSSIEMMSEHGFIAFGIWISMILGTLISLTRLPRKARDIPGMEWVSNYSYMLRTSLIAYLVGTSFLGLSYWDLLYHLIFISVLVKQFAMQEIDNYKKESSESVITQ